MRGVRSHFATVTLVCRARTYREAAQGVEHDITMLVAGIKRIGKAGEDGTTTITFGEVFKDEELEQQVKDDEAEEREAAELEQKKKDWVERVEVLKKEILDVWPDMGGGRDQLD